MITIKWPTQTLSVLLMVAISMASIGCGGGSSVEPTPVPTPTPAAFMLIAPVDSSAGSGAGRGISKSLVSGILTVKAIFTTTVPDQRVNTFLLKFAGNIMDPATEAAVLACKKQMPECPAVASMGMSPGILSTLTYQATAGETLSVWFTTTGGNWATLHAEVWLQP
jgi:hypothetical protein